MRRNTYWNTGSNVKTNDKKRLGSRRAFAVLLACMLLLSGCGKHDDLEKELGELDTDVSSDLDAGKASADVPERLTYTLGTSGYKFNVDADVTAVGYQNMKVYEQKLINIDDEYLKKLAEKVFDDGEYEVIKPYSICSMEELQAEKLFLKELYEEAGKEYPSFEIEPYIENYNEKNVPEFPEGTLIYHIEKTVEGETVGFENCRLRGMVDGNMAELHYHAQEGMIGTLFVSRMLYDNVYLASNVEYELASSLYGEN